MNSTVVRRRGRLAAALAGAMAATALSLAAPAYAEGDPTSEVDSNGASTIQSPDRCAQYSDEFRFRFFYHADYKGAWVNVGHPVYDLKSVDFGVGNSHPALTFCDGTGDGGGQQVANNSASAYNWYDGYCANVYYSAGYRGPRDIVPARNGGNLNQTKNNNRSVNFSRCW